MNWDREGLSYNYSRVVILEKVTAYEHFSMDKVLII